MVPIIEKLHNGTLNYHDFFAQHNKYRIIFPKIILLISDYMTKGNTVVQMYFIEFLLLILLNIYFKAFNKAFYLRKNYLWFMPIPFLQNFRT
jgi:hypothetical protein